MLRLALLVPLLVGCAGPRPAAAPPAPAAPAAPAVAPAAAGAATCERVAAHLVAVWGVDAERAEPIRGDCERRAYSDDHRRCLLAATRSSEASACGHEPYAEVSLGTLRSAPAAFAGKAVTVRAYVISPDGAPVVLGQRADASAGLPAIDAQRAAYEDVEVVPLADLAPGVLFVLRAQFDGETLRVEDHARVSPQPTPAPPAPAN